MSSLVEKTTTEEEDSDSQAGQKHRARWTLQTHNNVCHITIIIIIVGVLILLFSLSLSLSPYNGYISRQAQ